MKRAVSLLTTLMILVAGSRPVQAASNPLIHVKVFGIELCPQFICGAAIFSGFVGGQVGTNPAAFGTFAVAILHDPLPQLQLADITGGVFEIRVGLRRIRGEVSSGTLINNGDNTFTVLAVLTITHGGFGTMNFAGILNHNVFPPTIIGAISQ